MPRSLSWPGLAVAVTLAVTLSGCGGGGGSQTQAGAATPAFLSATPTPDAPSGPVVTPTPKPKPAATRAARTSPPGVATAPLMITIKNFTYSPMMLSVKLGQTIDIVNLDTATHTITSDDGSFDSGNLTQGQHYRFTPKKAGTYTYICDIHQYMTGTITVT